MDENKTGSAGEQESESIFNEMAPEFETADCQQTDNDGNTIDDETTETLVSDESVTAKTKRKWLIPGVIVGAIAVIASLVLVPQAIKADSVQKQLILGESFLDEGNYAEARLAYDKAIEIDPKAVQAYEKKAETYLLEDDYSEAENLIRTAQNIKQTSYGNLLLGEVYYETDRPEKGNEKLTEVAESSELDYETAQKAGELLSKQNDYALLEMLYENSLTKVKNKEERQGIYENLLETYLLQGKTEAELSMLVKRAQDAIGVENIKMLRCDEAEMEAIDTALNQVYCHWWAGVPDDFAAIDDFDLEWIIYKAIIDSIKNKTPQYTETQISTGEKGYFLPLEEVKKYGQLVISPALAIPEDSQIYKILYKSIKWDPDKQGFEWKYITNFNVNNAIYVENAIRINEKIYVTASELLIKDDRNSEMFEPDEPLYAYCNNQLVGTAEQGQFDQTTLTSNYIFSFNTDKIPNWTYVLQEKPNGGYFIVSKMKNAK
ncbi:tetratricopeptide repeat protein [Acetobacterium wieringae]|uniref:tetratricopeptide repeat protein n=1 Tax=Acetobacterium wieringae TaxID=52694 RepID=UPI003158CEEB